MTLPILVLRPLEGARKTKAQASKMGLDVIIDPLFVIEPMDWTPPPPNGFDALLITSANAIHSAGPALLQYKHLPVLAVGDATATAARNHGFQVEHMGSAGAQALLDDLPDGKYRHILRFTGRHSTTVIAPNRNVATVIVYQSKRLPFGGVAQNILSRANVTLLHSARAAHALSEEMDKIELDRSLCTIAAFSAKVADAAGAGWNAKYVSERPDDGALLSLASGLCRS